MSKEQLLELVAPLSPKERRELRELLDERAPMTEEEWAQDPVKSLLDEIAQMPPLDLPSDFGINHDFYIHGGNKRES